LCEFFEQHIKTNVVSKSLVELEPSSGIGDRHYLSACTKSLISIMMSRLWF